MFSSLAMDDFTDKCIGGTYPLIQTMHLALNDPLPEPPITEIQTTAVVTTASPKKKVKQKPKKKDIVKDKTKASETPTSTIEPQITKPVKGLKPKTKPEVSTPKTGRKRVGPPKRRKRPFRKGRRPVRVRLTPEQRKRLFRKKLKKHKGKIPSGWGKKIKSAGAKKDKTKNGKVKPKATAKKENVDTKVKPNEGTKSVNGAKDNGDKPGAVKNLEKGTKSKGENKTTVKRLGGKIKIIKKKAKGKPLKIGKKRKAKIIRRQGIGLKRKIRFKKGKGRRIRRRRKQVKKNTAKKAST